MDLDEEKYYPADDVDIKPAIGEEFATLDDAYSYYYQYSRQAGFNIRKDSSRKKKNGPDKGEIYWKRFACSKEGFRKNCTGKKMVSRCGCPAKMDIKLAENKWVTENVVEVHNHKLIRPQSKRNNPMYSNPSTMNAELSMGPSGIQNVLAEDDTRQDKLLIFEKRNRGLVKRDGQKGYGKDARAMCRYFEKRRKMNPNFYFTITLGKSGQLAHCFWVDERARIDYDHFGDVITFDTISKKNKYSMLFALFTGVNHHCQNVNFGCALLTRKTEASLRWLFNEWLISMGGKAPKTIITRQDPHMRDAISAVFPHSVHRFSLWHILEKVPKRLTKFYQLGSSFEEKWNECVYGVQTFEEFASKWSELLYLFPGLSEIEWLKKMWEIRDRWAPVYLKTAFSAGMYSTQRSERMKSYFKVNSRTPLHTFVKKFAAALRDRREEEKKADIEAINDLAPLRTSSLMEKRLRDVLTPIIFRKFQEEFEEQLACRAILKLEEVNNNVPTMTNETITVKTYDVIDQTKGKRVYTVSYGGSLGCSLKCSCCRWDFEGVVCRHIFKVLDHASCEHLPEDLLLKRWTKNVRSTSIFNTEVESDIDIKNNASQIERLASLTFLSNACNTAASATDEGTQYVKNGIVALLHGLPAAIAKDKASEDAALGDEVAVIKLAEESSTTVTGHENEDAQQSAGDGSTSTPPNTVFGVGRNFGTAGRTVMGTNIVLPPRIVFLDMMHVVQNPETAIVKGNGEQMISFIQDSGGKSATSSNQGTTTLGST